MTFTDVWNAIKDQERERIMRGIQVSLDQIQCNSHYGRIIPANPTSILPPSPLLPLHHLKANHTALVPIVPVTPVGPALPEVTLQALVSFTVDKVQAAGTIAILTAPSKREINAVSVADSITIRQTVRPPQMDTYPKVLTEYKQPLPASVFVLFQCPLRLQPTRMPDNFPTTTGL